MQRLMHSQTHHHTHTHTSEKIEREWEDSRTGRSDMKHSLLDIVRLYSGSQQPCLPSQDLHKMEPVLQHIIMDRGGLVRFYGVGVGSHPFSSVV